MWWPHNEKMRSSRAFSRPRDPRVAALKPRRAAGHSHRPCSSPSQPGLPQREWTLNANSPRRRRRRRKKKKKNVRSSLLAWSWPAFQGLCAPSSRVISCAHVVIDVRPCCPELASEVGATQRPVCPRASRARKSLLYVIRAKTL